MKVSICIPLYKYPNSKTIIIKDLLESIRIQTYKEYEIIISDQSEDPLEDYLKENFGDLPINYFRNEGDKGISTNINYAIERASGDIIKPMWQDDIFSSEDSLKFIVENYSGEAWGATSFYHFEKTGRKFKLLRPRYTEDILMGNNRIGGPSVVYFRRDLFTYFDRNLTWFMDCEFYYRLQRIYGNPKTYEEYLIGIRSDKNEPSATRDIVNDAVIELERKYLKETYGDLYEY